MSKGKSRESWEKFLNPGVLRSNLIATALFISSYEFFEDCIIDKPKTMFTNGFNENGFIIDKEYETEVLSKHKSPIYASLLWIKERGGINNDDMKIFEEIRQYRNKLVHELISFLSDAKREIDETKFETLLSLLSKIEIWWFEYFEMAVQPEILPEGSDPKEVIPGPIWSLKLMFDIALGNEPEEGFYYDAYKNHEKYRT